MKRSFWFLIGVTALVAIAAMAQGDGTDCFEVAQSNLPEASPFDAIATRSTQVRLWCYWDVAQDNRRYTMIFNADGSRFHPELAALVEWTADHHITEITHASLWRGKLSIHRSRLGAVNPLPVPLDRSQLGASASRTYSALAPTLYAQALRAMQDFRTTRARPYSIQMKEGTTEVMLEDNKLPFAGYWWPFAGVPLAAGAHSPLGKYDSVVARWKGRDPGSVAWEQQNHASTDVSWGGHCNGWAASSVLFPDFQKVLWDQDGRQVVLPSDIKGMLAEASFCVDFAFYGRRYYGNPGDDLSDIYPDKFHQVLVYYLSEEQKPIAMDWERDVPVDNNVITGYRMTISKVPDKPLQFHVVAELRIHRYDGDRREQGGVAEQYTRRYEYTLDTDAQGNVTTGAWLSDNPDFLWVPLATKADCAGKNPQVDPDEVIRISKTLPAAAKKVTKIDFNLNRKLAANEKISVPVEATEGTGYHLSIKGNRFSDEVEIVAVGSPMYPELDRDSVDDSMSYEVTLDQGADFVADIPLTNLTSLTIVNTSDKVTTDGGIALENIEYWGAPPIQPGEESPM